MVMDLKDPYRPCPCGSGKKYKFCCQQKHRQQAAQEKKASLLFFPAADDNDPALRDIPDDVLVFEMEEGRRLCTKGLKLMGKGQYKAAIPWLQKAHDAEPKIYTPANNLALCLLITGKLQGAIRVQRESLEISPLENPFGLANLASFLYIANQEDEARQYLEEACSMVMPSADACVKVCETLARFKRHKDILRVADRSDYKTHPDVCFFTGVAALNLGKARRARQDLLAVSLGHPKKEMVQRYLKQQRETGKPDTLLGDWPYLLPYEVCPIKLIEAELKRDEKDWGARRIAADICEAWINDDADKAPAGIMPMLDLATHPHAVKLLRAIVNGTFGPDQLRIQALMALQKRGCIGPKQDVEIFIKGRRTRISAMGTQMNPDIRYGGTLPPALEERYIKAIKASQARRPDQARLAETYLDILRQVPDFFPAEYNYAMTLLNRDRTEEAIPILQKLTVQHPEYLFAPASLLQAYLRQDQLEQARELVEKVDLPAEVHPAAMAIWQIAQTLYYEQIEEYQSARECLRMARQIAPDHPIVQQLSQDLL